MKSNNIWTVILILVLMTGCGGGGGGGNNSNIVTSTPPALVSLSLLPMNASRVTGALQQFTATGVYSDNSTQNLTASVSWTSSMPAVASISNATGSNGLATALAVGTTTITAAFGGISTATALTVTGGGSVNNEIPITVNGALCSANSYLNKPCISVTVCNPGTSTCQTINDILLDTGSYGLRIFKQALTVLPPATGNLAECVQFGDGSSMWGPVQTADVILGNEPVVQVPIQVVDSTFGVRPTGCSNADPTPAAAGFNGILGVGLFIHDCGTSCVTSASNGIYFACGASCSGTTVSLSGQVQNPAALLPQDNNGVLVQLPGIPLGGTTSVNGKLILGIGTQTNNVPASVTTYAANATTGEFVTLFGGRSYNSFIDSGSNGLFFTPPSTSQIPGCAAPNASWFCPASTASLSATNSGASGTPSGTVSFQIGNFTNLIANPSNSVFIEIGGTFSGNFDWGLPFFFGRNVFVGYGGSTSSLGSGPYWAY
ncbi:MAG: hypothetical protein CSYNP_01834 [Syntrophus sp. SKADARSKE-3]|nr:hypothetical protein [Syntrophus sp. SKADARSKE-3]